MVRLFFDIKLFAKIKISPNSFIILPKWQLFAKSSHTAKGSVLKDRKAASKQFITFLECVTPQERLTVTKNNNDDFATSYSGP